MLGQNVRVQDLATGKPVVLSLQNGALGVGRRLQPGWPQAGHGERRQDSAGLGHDHRRARLPRSSALRSGHPRRWNPDGSRVITVSNDTARVWDATTGKPVSPPLKHGDKIWWASFSPDGRRVVTASADNTAQVWDAESGTKVGQPLKHDNDLTLAEFSPDGRLVLTASRDNTARLWDSITGRPHSPPLRHTGPVMYAAFSPDGRRVVTASDDHTARVWDVGTGKPLVPPMRNQQFGRRCHASAPMGGT